MSNIPWERVSGPKSPGLCEKTQSDWPACAVAVRYCSVLNSLPLWRKKSKIRVASDSKTETEMEYCAMVCWVFELVESRWVSRVRLAATTRPRVIQTATLFLASRVTRECKNGPNNMKAEGSHLAGLQYSPCALKAKKPQTVLKRGIR